MLQPEPRRIPSPLVALKDRALEGNLPMVVCQGNQLLQGMDSKEMIEGHSKGSHGRRGVQLQSKASGNQSSLFASVCKIK